MSSICITVPPKSDHLSAHMLNLQCIHLFRNLQFRKGRVKRTGSKSSGEGVDAVCDDHACNESALALLSPSIASARSRFLIQFERSGPRISYRQCRRATWAGLLLRRLVSRLFLTFNTSLRALLGHLLHLSSSRARVLRRLTNFDGELLAEERHCE